MDERLSVIRVMHIPEANQWQQEQVRDHKYIGLVVAYSKATRMGQADECCANDVAQKDSRDGELTLPLWMQIHRAMTRIRSRTNGHKFSLKIHLPTYGQLWNILLA
jgi:hypothetical protein